MWLQQTPTAQCLVGGNGIIIIVQVDEVLPAVLSDWRCEKLVGKRHASIRLHTLTIDNKSKRTLQVTRLGVLRQSSKVAEANGFFCNALATGDTTWRRSHLLGDQKLQSTKHDQQKGCPTWRARSSARRDGQTDPTDECL